METSRREVLTIAAATVTLPMLQSALGTLQSAQAAARGGNRGPAGAPGRPGQAPPEQAGWFTTKLKASALKDNEFTAVEGHLGIVLSRSGKDVVALTTKCTHKGCTIRPKPGVKTLTCGCHQAQFNLDGTVAKPPANQPLVHFAIRTNAQGFIEIDPGQTPDPDAKEFKVTLS